MKANRITVPQRAKQVAQLIKIDKPDYYYLKELFRGLRKELNIQRETEPKKLPYVPTTEEIKQYYDVVWNSHNKKHMVMIRLMLYTGVKIGELVKIKISDVNIQKCIIRIDSDNKNNKERFVPFYSHFKISLSEYIKNIKRTGEEYLFESNREAAYSPQGIRRILADYSKLANMKETVTPSKLRHFLLMWMREQELDDDLIQSYSGNESKESFKIYSKLEVENSKNDYNKIMEKFPI
jgi:integrase/recombinase XerD